MKALSFCCFLLGANLLSAATPVVETTSVTVVVSSLVSTTSTVRLFFYNTREGFLKNGKWAYSKTVKSEGRREFTLPMELPKGEWAVVITQDLNNNEKLDTNFIGIPTEPYGFSNNIRPTMAAPKFDECKFLVDKPGKVVNIVLKK
ncbi:DUF2141 domain-containing protein [Hymenobacter terrenus]|uniref:DUF2141 domain-containing protein n=1 Tax=Hymenobacter terrenus TaxID=1629124 RepID=UPI0006962919|nr:DUF2141 domain-containing protein [Hymenobacter terrenus]